MLSDPEGILEAAITAIALADADLATAFFDEAAKISVFAPADVLSSGGAIAGRTAMAKRLARIFANFEVVRFVPRTILPCDEGLRTQIDYSFKHRATGASIDGVMRIVAAIADGRIVYWQEFQDGERVDAFMRLVRQPED